MVKTSEFEHLRSEDMSALYGHDVHPLAHNHEHGGFRYDIKDLQYEFLQNAFLTGIMIGFIAPLIGVFIVVRRLSLIADALSHVTLAGIAFSLLLEKYFLR